MLNKMIEAEKLQRYLEFSILYLSVCESVQCAKILQGEYATVNYLYAIITQSSASNEAKGVQMNQAFQVSK